MKKSSGKIVRYSIKSLKKLKDKTQYKRIDAMTDKDIDYSDIPELDKSIWAKGKIIDHGRKKAISLRVDPEVLEWFKSQEGRYQHLMNKVLRHYMQTHL